MFHLQSGIHFHKEKTVVLRIKNKLNRARVVVPDCTRCCNGCLADLQTQVVGDARGSFFDDFLVAALYGAIALVQVNVITVLVTKDLDFDMARLLDVPLNNHVIVIETLHGLVLG